MKTSALKLIPGILFGLSLLCSAAIMLEAEPAECDCVVDCYIADVTGIETCDCPTEKECSTTEGEYCTAILTGDGIYGDHYRCQCKDEDTANQYWEAECLCKYEYEIGSQTGRYYMFCSTNQCTGTACFKLELHEYGPDPQQAVPGCECR